ncbi:MAG: rhomboid family intramembrane serine protease [Candidatus Aminicenantia bacterium]
MFIPFKDENPTRRFPFITVFLILTNILIFLYQHLSPEGIVYYIKHMSLIPYEITHFVSFHFRVSPPLTFITSLFMHGDIFHITGNMLYLWIFGNNVEDFLGPIKFIIFYILSGIVASLTHIIFHPNSTVPLVGASGAISGILGAYLLLFPYARIHTFVFLFFIIKIIQVPAYFILIFWFLWQLINIGISGIAWFAHIGGFLFGLFFISFFVKRKRIKFTI